ncbi:MAG: N-acetylmuramoyl-L-alanine amidase [Bacteroidetes bacterium]|nr:N-acetylmuramoyl-L-alanine amidase [Bacteroidota bacterium]MCB0846060.1 N-acetylmuramoyl-L-alanine amidase [Bacteroidota bacterium]
MMEQILQFFRRLFGIKSPNSSIPQGEDTPKGLEDAADIIEEEVVSLEEEPRPEATFRTRSLESAAETVDIDATFEESLNSITITTPRFLWCIDNGHGRLQDGKRSPIFDDGVTQFEEWKFNRDIVKRVASKLEDIGVQVFVVVPEDDIGSATVERSNRANQQPSPLGLPKIFLSVHSNAAAISGWNDGVTGIETWHFPNSTQGMPIASVFQDELVKRFPEWADRGIRSHLPGSHKIFTVLQVPQMPSVLTENGYYTDRQQAAELMKDEVRQKIANAHIAAILRIEQEGIENLPLYHKRMVIA